MQTTYTPWFIPHASSEKHLCTNIPTSLVLGSCQTDSMHTSCRLSRQIFAFDFQQTTVLQVCHKAQINFLHLVYTPTLSKLYNFYRVKWELTVAVWKVIFLINLATCSQLGRLISWNDRITANVEKADVTFRGYYLCLRSEIPVQHLPNMRQECLPPLGTLNKVMYADGSFRDNVPAMMSISYIAL
jgi:hypothetical protein